jgi:phosphomannomutase
MSTKGRTLGELLGPLRERYFISGEINTRVASMDEVSRKLDGLAQEYADAPTAYRMDGLSVEYPDWHFNVRPSNTEPLLRLNLEAASAELMGRRRDEVLSYIRA